MDSRMERYRLFSYFTATKYQPQFLFPKTSDHFISSFHLNYTDKRAQLFLPALLS